MRVHLEALPVVARKILAGRVAKDHAKAERRQGTTVLLTLSDWSSAISKRD